MYSIKNEFITSVNKILADDASTLWKEVENQYSNSNRYYHTLAHLEHLLVLLTPWKAKLENWDVIVFSIAYHDAIYNPLKNNNEEKSAALAVQRLTQLHLAPHLVSAVSNMILATKKHEPADYQTNLFTDADLAILGTDEGNYREYTQQIRKEYNIFPDLIYKPGRKKVLEHFLKMPRIYKTKEFFDQFESNARKNLELELLTL